MKTKLKKIREELGFTQQSLAAELGITKSAYNNLELGKKDGKLRTWLNIQKALALTNDELVETMKEGIN